MRKVITTLTVAMLYITTSTSQNYPELVKITGGTFIMGDRLSLDSKDKLFGHQVTLTDYAIGKTEVTVAQYSAYCRAKGISMPIEPDYGWQDNAPIGNISWNDALNYCDWLSEKLDKKISLPTEAQWEYAARGGALSKNYDYAAGNSMETIGWYEGNSFSRTHTIASKKANELGLYDMSGNVWEWCFDWYQKDYYVNSPSENPKNITRGDMKVLRGGGYGIGAICHLIYRNPSEPDIRHDSYGFRIVSF